MSHLSKREILKGQRTKMVGQVIGRSPSSPPVPPSKRSLIAAMDQNLRESRARREKIDPRDVDEVFRARLRKKPVFRALETVFEDLEPVYQKIKPHLPSLPEVKLSKETKQAATIMGVMFGGMYTIYEEALLMPDFELNFAPRLLVNAVAGGLNTPVLLSLGKEKLNDVLKCFGKGFDDMMAASREEGGASGFGLKYGMDYRELKHALVSSACNEAVMSVLREHCKKPIEQDGPSELERWAKESMKTLLHRSDQKPSQAASKSVEKTKSPWKPIPGFPRGGVKSSFSKNDPPIYTSQPPQQYRHAE